ncbi:MAG: hypothetical protein WKG07_08940 [Hymenobacter sp.]
MAIREASRWPRRARARRWRFRPLEITVLGKAGPRSLPAAEEGHVAGAPARNCPPAAPHQHLRGGAAHPHALAFAIPPVFQRPRLFYVHTPIITGSDAEGAGQMFRVTTLPPEHPPRTADGSVDYQPGFLRQANSTSP